MPRLKMYNTVYNAEKPLKYQIDKIMLDDVVLAERKEGESKIDLSVLKEHINEEVEVYENDVLTHLRKITDVVYKDMFNDAPYNGYVIYFK